MTVWHVDSGYRYAGAIIFLIVLQWVAAMGRVAVRTLVVKKFGWDDVALLITLLISTAYHALFLTNVYLSNGGVRADHVPPGNLIPSINVTLSTLVTYIAGSSALKVACGMLLLRVLVRPWQVRTIYVSMLISVLYGIFYFFFILFQCGNPNQFHVKILFGQCLSREAIDGTTYTHSLLMAGIDLVFAALPVALIWSADLSNRAKLSVVGILSLGSVAVVATFVRLAYVHDLSKPTPTFLRTSQPIGLLSAAELSIGVTCISMCTYKPFFRRYFGQHGSSDDSAPASPQATASASFHVEGRRPYSQFPRQHPPEVKQISTSDSKDWPLREEKDVDLESNATSPSSPRKHTLSVAS